ncbi:MAG TPA: hypothetical protein PKN33_10710 [Phycisphaerae bacterium]|nr:hypothetical protein [Phycisphaerae bacterium]
MGRFEFLKAFCIAICAALWVGEAAACPPVDIAIANAGFEDDPVSPGCFEVMPLDDWLEFDPNGVLDGGLNSVGGINLPLGSVFFPGGAPEREHAALVFLFTSTGMGPAGLRQELSATLQPNTTYTLSAQVGNIATGIGPPPCDVFGEFDIDGFPGYQVQLLAGGEIIAVDDNGLAGALGEGEFELSTCEAIIGPSHDQLGQNLEIRLINLNEAETPENPGIEVDFDDVRLTSRSNAPPALGDLDCDGDRDLEDYGLFERCLAGPNQPPATLCGDGVDADLDDDNDVDLADFVLIATSIADSP